MNYKTQIHWQCHCWNLQYTFYSNKNLDDFQWRKCKCSFCISHWANWLSDSDWKIEIQILDDSLVSKYQNKNSLSDKITRLTADFYVCKNCWVLTVAISNINWNNYSVFNLNSSEYSKLFADNFIKTNFDWEILDERLTRRSKNWTKNVIFK